MLSSTPPSPLKERTSTQTPGPQLCARVVVSRHSPHYSSGTRLTCMRSTTLVLYSQGDFASIVHRRFTAWFTELGCGDVATVHRAACWPPACARGTTLCPRRPRPAALAALPPCCAGYTISQFAGGVEQESRRYDCVAVRGRLDRWCRWAPPTPTCKAL